jgi:phenylpropionate dioxygenase-like ring-hydroxylating dioxygenase large terminal subunit
MPGLRNQWYVAMPSSRLAHKPRATRVLDLELVLFRDREGIARALLDRCPHRGVRLSLGRMTEGALACGYHGWRFAGDGACVHIPSLVHGQRIAAGCEVPAFRTVEQDGYVWVWVADATPTPELPPAIPDFDARRWLQGTVEMRCDALKFLENNFDWCHTYFAHVGSHPAFFRTQKLGFVDHQYELRVSERGLDVFTPVTADESAPIPEAPLSRLTYEVTNRVTVEFDFGKRTRIVMHVVPTGASTCRLEWLYTPIPLPLGRGRPLFWPLEPRVIREDRVLLESSQPWYDREPEQRFERSVEADTSTLMLRRIHGMVAAGTWPEKWSSLPRRRLVEIRA